MRAASHKISAVLIITGIILSSLFSTLGIYAFSSQDTAILTIDIQPGLCILNAIVKPEKRLPDTNHWSTIVTLEIFDLNQTSLGTLSGRSNNFGIVSFDICTQNLQLQTETNYNIYVRGLSHLKKYYSNFKIVLGSENTNDFSTTQKVLLAGETSVISDNYINSLDLSTQVRAFRKTDDEKNDLNRDNKVNSLDLSNTAYNFRKKGD